MTKPDGNKHGEDLREQQALDNSQLCQAQHRWVRQEFDRFLYDVFNTCLGKIWNLGNYFRNFPTSFAVNQFRQVSLCTLRSFSRSFFFHLDWVLFMRWIVKWLICHLLTVDISILFHSFLCLPTIPYSHCLHHHRQHYRGTVEGPYGKICVGRRIHFRIRKTKTWHSRGGGWNREDIITCSSKITKIKNNNGLHAGTS